MSPFVKKILVIVINTVALFVFAFAPNTFSFQDEGTKYHDSEFTVLQGLSCYGDKSFWDRPYPGGVLIGYLIIIAFVIVIVAYIMSISNKRLQQLTDQVLQVLTAVPLAVIMLMLAIPVAIPVMDGNYPRYVMRPGFPGYTILALCITCLVITLVIPIKESAQAGETITTMPNRIHLAETKATEPMTETPKPKDDMTWADTLMKYKALLDEGVITEEDFNKKKKELMGL